MPDACWTGAAGAPNFFSSSSLFVIDSIGPASLSMTLTITLRFGMGSSPNVRIENLFPASMLDKKLNHAMHSLCGILLTVCVVIGKNSSLLDKCATFCCQLDLVVLLAI